MTRPTVQSPHDCSLGRETEAGNVAGRWNWLTLEGIVVKKTYTELMEQIETLRQEAEKARAAEIQGVIERIREAIKFYELTPEDLGFAASSGGRSTAAGRARAKNGGREPKFSDGSGNVWSGRGPRPRWLKDALSKGANLEQFSTTPR